MRGVHTVRSAVVTVCLSIPAALLIGGSSASSAPGTDPSTIVEAPSPDSELISTSTGGINQACVDVALASGVDSWTCLGDTLTTAEETTDGRDLVKSVHVPNPDGSPTLEDASVNGIAPLAGNNYDSWCENGSICGRKINNYTAEVKGNGAYGNSSGAIGQVDVVLRQAFNGRWPMWRSLLIHDGGPKITPGTYTVRCRINKTGPDGWCGGINVHHTPISSSKRRSWVPSKNSMQQSNERLVGSTKYHDDAQGQFKAAGYSQTFYFGLLHTGRWHTCSANCKYYQVPWK